MAFQSILYKDRSPAYHQSEPGCFHDLQLGAVVAGVTKGYEGYDLSTFFYTPLTTVPEVIYRQGVLRDLQVQALRQGVQLYTDAMTEIRGLDAVMQASRHPQHQCGIFLLMVSHYLDAVQQLAGQLGRTPDLGEAMTGLATFLRSYLGSEDFNALSVEGSSLGDELSNIRYAVIIDELQVTVRDYRREPDFGGDIRRLFDRFKTGTVKDYKHRFPSGLDMNDVEAKVLDGVVRLFPDFFDRLNAFYHRHADFLHPVLTAFYREVHFFMSWFQYTEKLQEAGYGFCFPSVEDTPKQVLSKDGFDLALAAQFLQAQKNVVVNDFFLEGKERMIIISGPNQGGKTTLARQFGQLHYLASLGLTIPGSKARTFLFDHIFTQFEREERAALHRSKLEDDLLRIHDMLATATTRSIIIFNEMFSSTSLQDGLLLAGRVMQKLDRLDCLCVWVTFMDELNEMSDKTVSMVSTVVPADVSARTFKVVRQSSNGIAYALSIAQKYRLTYEQLTERLTDERTASV